MKELAVKKPAVIEFDVMEFVGKELIVIVKELDVRKRL